MNGDVNVPQSPDYDTLRRERNELLSSQQRHEAEVQGLKDELDNLRDHYEKRVADLKQELEQQRKAARAREAELGEQIKQLQDSMVEVMNGG
jgi:hypothetical protein